MADDRTPLSETIHAFSLILAMIAEDLEKSGTFSRADFAKRLTDAIDEAEKSAPEHLRSSPRVDFQVARLVASLMHKGKPSAPAKWTPVVIEGGADDPQPDQH